MCVRGQAKQKDDKNKCCHDLVNVTAKYPTTFSMNHSD